MYLDVIIIIFSCMHLRVNKHYYYVIPAVLGKARFRKIHRHGTILRLAVYKVNICELCMYREDNSMYSL